MVKALGQILIGFLLLVGAANGRSFVRMCYYNARRTNYNAPDNPSIMSPEQIDPSLCTDVVWAHGYIDPANKTISACRVGDSHCRNLFQKFKTFRANHTALFFSISIDGTDVRGGGSEKQHKETKEHKKQRPDQEIEQLIKELEELKIYKQQQQQRQKRRSKQHSQLDKIRTFGSVSQHDSDRHTFAANVVKYLKDHQMDGLIIDWESPSEASKTDTMYVELLKRLHTKLAARNSGRPGMFLAVTLANLPEQVMDSYDVQEVHPHVDYLVVKCYDYHLLGSGPERFSFSSPLYSESPKITIPSLSSTLLTYIYLMDVPVQKILVGLSWKATRYIMPSDGLHAPGLPGTLVSRFDKSLQGATTLKEGWTGSEVCGMIYELRGAKEFYDVQQEVAYITWGGIWIGLEDQKSVTRKIKFIARLGVAGVMINDVGMDDFQGWCKRGKFPLMNAIKEEAAWQGLGKAMDNGDNRVRCSYCYGVTAPVATSLLAAFITMSCY